MLLLTNKWSAYNTITRTAKLTTSKTFACNISQRSFNPSKFKLHTRGNRIVPVSSLKQPSAFTASTVIANKSWIDSKIFDDVRPYLKLARVDKPIGTWLLLWPCLWSIGIGNYAIHTSLASSWQTVGLFSLGSFIMRGAGCTINDLADRDIDGKVERTKTRPLAAKEVTVKQAIKFLALQLSAGLGVLLCLNNYSIVLGASSLSVVFLYPFMKRVTYWPQMVLGLAFNWGALLGYSAVVGYCDWPVVLPLYVAGISWTLVYDTIYAHQDKDDDMLIGVKSTALRFGEQTKQWLTFFSTTTIGGLVAAGIAANMPLPYFLATTIGAGHLVWQISTLDINNKQDCLKKFVSNKWFGAIIFAGIALSGTIL